jgi:hypothetical protein
MCEEMASVLTDPISEALLGIFLLRNRNTSETTGRNYSGGGVFTLSETTCETT